MIIPHERLDQETLLALIEEFVTRDGTRFTPVRITTGSEGAEGVEVVSGLESDSRIATRGSFVLKSELLKGQTEGGN
jgi:hypothetical protein